ncbi:glycosyltransferase family A protein [soil metagenome]
MSLPKVSVIIPAYNADPYLAEAVESILSQRGGEFEVLIVDDGSTDRTAAIAGAFGPPVRLLQQPHLGMAAARNHGVRESTGEFIAFLDADDRWAEGKVDMQLAALEADPALQHVFGMQSYFAGDDADLNLVEAMPKAPVPGILPSALLSRRAAVMALGPFPSDVQVGEFIAWFARASELGQRERILPQVVLHRRVHSQNLTLRNREAFSDYARIVRQVLQRRRAAGSQ